MPPKKNATPIKPPEDSTMIHEESEDMSFRVSQLEQNFKGMVKTLDLYNLEKRIQKKLKENMERMVSQNENYFYHHEYLGPHYHHWEAFLVCVI